MQAVLAAYAPWTDRTGRFSAFRAAVFAAVLAPALWLAWRASAGLLGPRAVTAAIHDAGVWAVRFWLLSLLVTPLRALTRKNALIGVRRMLGLAGFGYAALHATLYVVDQRYDLVKVAGEIALRTYLTIGFAALIGLVVLASTSTDGALRRMGAESWGRLHRWSYALVVLALVHFFLQRKLDVTEPALMAGLFLWLMGWRWLKRLGRAESLPALAGLAVASGLGTMLLEATYYSLRNGFPIDRILAANLQFDIVIRPGWWVMAAGLGVAALAAGVRYAFSPRPSSTPG